MDERVERFSKALCLLAGVEMIDKVDIDCLGIDLVNLAYRKDGGRNEPERAFAGYCHLLGLSLSDVRVWCA